MSRALYGNARGHWAQLTWPTGLVAPPVLGMHQPLVGPVELTYLGHPGDVMSRICVRHGGGNKRPAQQAIARLLGVTQQSVSRYAQGQTLPPTIAVPIIVRMWFDPQLVEDAMAAIEAEGGSDGG